DDPRARADARRPRARQLLAMSPSRSLLPAAVATGLGFVVSVSAQDEAAVSTRDLSGVWLLDGNTASFSDVAAPPMTPWAVERFRANAATVGASASMRANDPTLRCLPPGVPYVLTIPTPFEIIELEDEILQIFEYDHSIRRIHVDGRDWPGDLQLTGMHQWMGYSIGSWDKDTLIIETRGFNDSSWLDRSGHPHSEGLVVIERIRRLDRDTLVDEITIHDPEAYTQPWHGTLTFELKEDWELFEHICIGKDVTSPEYLDFKGRAWEAAQGTP
ncbi:MAG TPA: hypothetical protein VLD39_12885, partial [Gammaproteobacteria bacterium]|nr:hypothetical protein [Gammaproteobacteria bacterium]